MVIVGDTVRWSARITATRYRHPAPHCPLCLGSRLVPQRCQSHQPILLSRVDAPNLIVNLGLNAARDMLAGDVTDLTIRYMAWGSSSATPAAGNTTLGSEDGRKAITSRAAGVTGVMVTSVYLAIDDANGVLEELGWFASPTATATTDSGIMIARALYPGGAETKAADEAITIDRTDTFA